LTDSSITTYNEAVLEGYNLAAMTNCNVYIKGGHFDLENEDEIREYIVMLKSGQVITKPIEVFEYSHVTGCFFASALACYLVKYVDIVKACKMATEEVSKFYVDLNKV
jgi:hydroxymethylpyrimidine/phosphomethylpyrimidine kinase